MSQPINFDLFDYYKIEAYIDGNKLDNFGFTILSKTLVKFDLIYDIDSLLASGPASGRRRLQAASPAGKAAAVVTEAPLTRVLNISLKFESPLVSEDNYWGFDFDFINFTKEIKLSDTSSSGTGYSLSDIAYYISSVSFL